MSTNVIDIAALVSALRERGVSAIVEHTGGGSFAVFAGSRFVGPDGVTRFAVSAGPVFERVADDGAVRLCGVVGEFGWGPDDDRMTGAPIAARASVADVSVLADAIVAVARVGRVSS